MSTRSFYQVCLKHFAFHLKLFDCNVKVAERTVRQELQEVCRRKEEGEEMQGKQEEMLFHIQSNPHESRHAKTDPELLINLVLRATLYLDILNRASFPYKMY